MMEGNEKQHISKLLKTKNYKELYQSQASVINEMLLINNQEDFEDFLGEDNFLDEKVFWLYYSAVYGESLMIGGYDEDVTETVLNFLQGKLSDEIINVIKDNVQQMYVDLGTRNHLEERIQVLNQYLEKQGYLIQLEYDETYCAGVYFLSVERINL